MKCQCKGHKCFDVRGCEERRKTNEQKEHKQAHEMMYILKPCLKKNCNGLFDTNIGDKTAIGLVRVIKRIFREGYNLEEDKT